MRIAIVGSGVSGLVSAHLLHHEHDVTLFESRARIGGHVNTISYEDECGRWSIDTGFIVYNEANYPRFSKLLDALGVESQESDMSFSVRCDRTGLEYNGSTVRQLFTQKRNLLSPSYLGMIRDILRFNREAPTAVDNGARDLRLGEYLEAGRYSPRLAEHYLVPMGSALWSVPRQRVLEMPAEFFVRFFENHNLLTVNDRPTWRTVVGGSARYVEALVRPFRHRIRTSTPVHSVRRDAQGVLVNGERFDQVVLACHSDQALAMLDDPRPAERQILGALPYQKNEVVLHTDTRVLPRRRLAWGAWNYQISGSDDAPASVTYNMNVLQALESPRTFCVTLNPSDPIDPSTVIYEARYSHPMHTLEGSVAQARWAEISGVNHTHYCGAYWGYGFHEDGVRSAARVADSLAASPGRCKAPAMGPTP